MQISLSIAANSLFGVAEIAAARANDRMHREGNRLADRDQHPMKRVLIPFLRRGAEFNTIGAAALSLLSARHAVATHFQYRHSSLPDPDNLAACHDFTRQTPRGFTLLRISLLAGDDLFNRPRMKFHRHAAVGHRQGGIRQTLMLPFRRAGFDDDPRLAESIIGQQRQRARAFKVAGSPGRTISICSQPSWG